MSPQIAIPSLTLAALRHLRASLRAKQRRRRHPRKRAKKVAR